MSATSLINITIDQQIPLAKEIFNPWGRVTTLPQSEITNQALGSSDCLIIRSVTKVNHALLSPP